ncbi:MAG: DUF4959 domain-containing protein [Dysgonamonadaceae bacterium]|jgi:hypothetical protein|nr:DUF4959 domain-containing protein [Dysgonamonadaceae bacterium]
MITNSIKKQFFLFMAVIGGMMFSCSEPADWSDPKDSIAPGPVSNVQIENTNGGAIITYTLPSDNDLLGAKVTYSYSAESELMEKYASQGADTIELEGFGDTGAHEITIYAIDKSGNLSEGITQTIQPLTPAIDLMRESLEATPVFGGVSFTWENKGGKDMGLSLYVPDTVVPGEWTLFDTYFSEAKAGKAVFRPFDAVEQNFRIEMFDRWNNYSQPYETSLVPLEEYLLPGRISSSEFIWNLYDDDYWLWRGEIHNNMNASPYNGRVFALVHDGRGQSNGGSDYWMPGNDGDPIENYIPGAGSAFIPFPLYFTVDMGRKAFYSRFNLKPRLRDPNYSAALPCDFEIWGTNNPKHVHEVGDGSRAANMAYWTSWEAANGTDAWKNDGWTKIATCKLTMSSGESKYVAGMVLSETDIANYRTNGFDFDINEGVTEGFRYLRWVINDTNTSQKNIQICEITFWGSYTD